MLKKLSIQIVGLLFTVVATNALAICGYTDHIDIHSVTGERLQVSQIMSNGDVESVKLTETSFDIRDRQPVAGQCLMGSTGTATVVVTKDLANSCTLVIHDSPFSDDPTVDMAQIRCTGNIQFLGLIHSGIYHSGSYQYILNFL